MLSKMNPSIKNTNSNIDLKSIGESSARKFAKNPACASTANKTLIRTHREVLMLLAKEEKQPTLLKKPRSKHKKPTKSVPLKENPKENPKDTPKEILKDIHKPRLIPRPTIPSFLTKTFFEDASGSLEDYAIKRTLGKGSYGIVREAVRKQDGLKVAIKTYEKMRIFDPYKRNCLSSEIKILKRLDHPNIMKILDLIETKSQVHLVLEYISGASLHEYMKSQPDKKLEEREAKAFFVQICEALSHCHSLNVTHRDIKLDNILIDKHKTVKLIDFGFSTCFSHKYESQIFCGTPCYMAPEIVRRRNCIGPPVDIWALGVILYAMHTGGFPFKALSDKDLFRKIERGSYNLPACIPIPVKLLIKRMLEPDMNKRPTVHYVLQDPWIKPPVSNSHSKLHVKIQEKFESIDLNIVMDLKLMGFSEQDIFRDVKAEKTEIYKLYRKMKLNQTRRLSV